MICGVVALLLSTTFGQATLLFRHAHKGCIPGLGSPPCVKTYYGSGDIMATPAPGKNSVPTPNPGGSMMPGCVCPGTFPGMFPPPPMKKLLPSNETYVVQALKAGVIEVATVDVKTANWVRCDNVSVAKEVAKFLKIPLKRVTVTPWSWTVGVPQSNYLAFVQEDHQRCGCDVGDGRTAQEQGFRRVEAAQARDGFAVASLPDTSVMTVAQYKAMMAAKQTTTPSPLAKVATGKGNLLTTRTTTPPPARVQMLTRDPCLVALLRVHTSYFHRELARLLHVPEEYLIVDPPPVKGTVGLLQLDSSLNVEKSVRQLPVLAVQQCSSTEFHQRERGLKLELISKRNATNYAVAANASMPKVYTVAGPPNNTNNTNVTYNITNQRVYLAMNLTHLDYDMLARSWPLVSSFTTATKAAIGTTGHVPSAAVKIALYPGSVVVEATITPPPNTAATAILAFLNGTVCNETSGRLNAMMALQSSTTGIINCSQVDLKLINPPWPPDETNRAWIAFWAVVIREPYAERASWELLNLINDEKSDITKLLPMTLGRVPGLKYRALKEPQKANETRLPPPLDKAVGFRLPNPLNMEEALKAEMRRIAKEREEAEFVVKEKSAAEQLKITSSVAESKKTRALLKQADTTILAAAKAHAHWLFTSPPDIDSTTGESSASSKAATSGSGPCSSKNASQSEIPNAGPKHTIAD